MLFIIGGLVRSTGSGMGCPDWPKCFGEYFPPTDIADLPANYEDYYQNQRVEKTKRFSLLLDLFGFEDLSKKIRNSKQLEEKHEFNVIKAFVEYSNRIWGALTGLLVFLCFLSSFTLLKSHSTVFLYTLLGFLAVFINALLGAVVVNSNLISGIVTSHFLAAFASLGFFILARVKYLNLRLTNPSSISLKVLGSAILIILVIQTVAGAQVREAYEYMERNNLSVIDNILSIAHSYNIHRITAIVVLGLTFFQYQKLKSKETVLKKYLLSLPVLTALQIIIGVMLIYQNLESVAKLFHISIGAAIFVIQFYICMLLLKSSNK